VLDFRLNMTVDPNENKFNSASLTTDNIFNSDAFLTLRLLALHRLFTAKKRGEGSLSPVRV
jgi:hypothetical protein